MAVRHTDSSIFALASELMKLEILPPGQEATRIMPSAMVHEIHPTLSISKASRNVSSGSRTSWQHTPRMTDLGFWKTSTKVCGLMPSATPYITKARTMLMVFMPPAFIVTLMLSMAASIPGFMVKVLGKDYCAIKR